MDKNKKLIDDLLNLETVLNGIIRENILEVLRVGTERVKIDNIKESLKYHIDDKLR